ncbi:unnamed protein product [Ixodes persulcatus]
MSQTWMSQREIQTITAVSMGRVDDVPCGTCPPATSVVEDQLIIAATGDDPFLMARDLKNSFNFSRFRCDNKTSMESRLALLNRHAEATPF